MTDVRIVNCEVCHSEGWIIPSKSGHPNDPDDGPGHVCFACEGTGRVVIEVEPMEEEDQP